MNAAHATLLTRPSPEEIYASLPPLDSAEYLRRLRTAPTEELPPEVLARAYRELAFSGNETAAEATLARLLGDKNGRPEYLRFLLLMAARKVPPHQNWQEALDLYQDTVALIIEVLPAEQGRWAERAWATFCRQRLIDAWRRRQGRRGERLEPPRLEPAAERPAEEDFELFDLGTVQAPWHAAMAPDKLAWLENFVVRALEGISDPFVRAVAQDQWLAEQPSPISGKTNGKPPLTERWGKSRFQVHRALRWARSYLLAALESQDEMEIELEPFRPAPRPTRNPTRRRS